MVKFGIGQPVRRVEDLRLLTGNGRYTDDVSLARQAYAYFLRSPHAHARIGRLDAAAAKRAAGVLGVFTGADLQAAGIGDIPCMAPVVNRDGTAMKIPPRPAIARTHVHFVGDTVAMVVGETLAAARDAAELIEVDYDPLPAATDAAAAMAPGAAKVWDFLPDNTAFDWTLGDEAKTKAGFAAADRVIKLDLVNNRVAPTSMEPRNALGDYAAMDGKFTLYVSCQSTHGLRKVLADYIFKVPESKVRVVSPDVGGGFGMKIFMYPEYVNVLLASRVLGRPVKWTGERSEAFLTDTHGRDHHTHAELALDKTGRFLAFHVTTQANLGAYASHYGPFIPTAAGCAMLNGVYAFPAVFVEVKGVYTNTAPIDAYRGAGRPEANYVVERAVDAAARATGLSPAEIRRRNFIPPASMPFKTALGSVYDTGHFEKNMDDALKAAEWSGFAARRTAAKAAGKLRGIGIATYIEACGGGADETAQIRVAADGSVAVLIGNQSNGQGHETMYAQLVADRLGVPFESVRVIQGDSDAVLYTGLTGGSRATSVGGTAALTAAERIIAKGRTIAAHVMETAEADVEFTDGRFRVAGTDKTLSFHDVVKVAYTPARLPPGLSPGLDETANSLLLPSTFPNGCHVCEVEIDAGTGAVSIARYTIVDDFGRVINPLTLAGQVHGGTVQGIGQALYEDLVYDAESGQLITGSFMDYCLPRADNVPSFSFAYNEIPTTANRLGVKGSGEAGAIGAPPAVMNAVIDALSEYGVDQLDMPATPEKIWRIVQRAPVPQAAE
jgi:aerobic carbon-monoxide dehydrogenase large subunit